MANEEDVDDLITFSDFRTAFDILVKLRRDLIITIDGSVDDDVAVKSPFLGGIGDVHCTPCRQKAVEWDVKIWR